ncbi:MAG: copper resistance D family protein [Nitrospiria bacterium]
MALFRWLDIVGVVMCVGTIAFRRLIFLPSIQMLGDDQQRTLLEETEFFHTKRVIFLSLVYLLILHLLTLVHQAEMMSGSPLSGIIPVLPLVLKRTHFGLIWLTKLFLLVSLFVMTSFRLKTKPTPLLMVSLLLCLTGSLSGHAVSRSPFLGIILSDWFHYSAVSLWIGGLFPLRWVSGKSARLLQPGRLGFFLEKTLTAFSRWAVLCVMTILMTGMINAGAYLGWQSGFDIPYFRVLLSKLALVGLVLLLGAVSRFYFLPAFSEDNAGGELERRFRLVLTIEIGFAVLTLILAALLTQTSPPHFVG